MKHSQNRTFMDIQKIKSNEFKVFCRSSNKNYFTRVRKMPLHDLLFTMINRKGLTLALELRNYMKIAHPGTSISKPGYLKQRMKLNPDAFLELYKYHNRNFYADSSFLTYKDHLILAADGSALNIPTTAETLELYGSTSRKTTKPQAQIGLGCIYDVMNRMILESDCNRVKFDEMRLAQRQLERIPETIGDIPFIIIMDRGYPSTPAFIHMMDKNIKFIVRLKRNDYKKEQNNMSENDQLVKIKFDMSRIRCHEGTMDGERMKELGEISLRMVKIPLENGNWEVLATNLSQSEFNTEEISELYHMRWEIETAYETLKSRLQIENFTGTKPILLLQDIYSTIYVSNLAEDIILDAERELDQKETNRKHKMMINQTVSIGILKNDLIYILLETDDQKKNILFQQIYEDISKNLVPIRPDRHYTRTKGRLAGKYSNTHKRAY